MQGGIPDDGHIVARNM